MAENISNSSENDLSIDLESNQVINANSSSIDSPNNRSPINRSPINPSPNNRSSNNRSPINRSPINSPPNNRSPINRSPNNRSPINLSKQKNKKTKNTKKSSRAYRRSRQHSDEIEQICRYCHEEVPINRIKKSNHIVRPCLCKNYLHQSCFQEWWKNKPAIQCEICHTKYRIKLTVEKKLNQEQANINRKKVTNKLKLCFQFIILLLVNLISLIWDFNYDQNFIQTKDQGIENIKMVFPVMICAWIIPIVSFMTVQITLQNLKNIRMIGFRHLTIEYCPDLSGLLFFCGFITLAFATLFSTGPLKWAYLGILVFLGVNLFWTAFLLQYTLRNVTTRRIIPLAILSLFYFLSNIVGFVVITIIKYSNTNQQNTNQQNTNQQNTNLPRIMPNSGISIISNVIGMGILIFLAISVRILYTITYRTIRFFYPIKKIIQPTLENYPL